MRPKKVVITAAGMGTRLLPMSKELPKEMLPLFAREGKSLTLKPLLQLLFEQFYEFGFRDFCFVVGRGKRAIEDHFTQDSPYLEYLGGRGKADLADTLGSFYQKVEESSIVWVNQAEPGGFGDAVLKAQGFVGVDEFVVAAGDTLIVPPRRSGLAHLERLFEVHTTSGSDATFVVMKVTDPENYGIVLTSRSNPAKVLSVEEKPSTPKSNIAIMPLYAFKPAIFDALRSISRNTGGELQLTDAIQELIGSGREVRAVKLRPDEKRLDIGTPRTYWDAISESYRIGIRP